MGTDLRTTPHSYTDTGMTTRGAGSARTLTIIGFVCAAVGVFFLPIVFATVAIVLGAVARSKGDRLGTWVIVAGVGAFLVNLALAAWILSEAGETGNTGTNS